MEAKISNRKGYLIRVAEWLEVHGSSMLQQAAPYMFALCCLWLGHNLPGLLALNAKAPLWLDKIAIWASSKPVIACVVVFILGVWATVLRNKSISQLKSSNQNLTGDLVRAKTSLGTMRANLDTAEQHAELLRATFSKANLASTMAFLRLHCKEIQNFGDHARVSLYAHSDGQFILAGRFTEHPEHIKPNRLRFPCNQGCIGKAWLEGGDAYIELPDPNQDETIYLNEASSKCNINQSETQALRMKSRFYYAKAVSHDRIRVGVVLYESTRPDVINPEFLSSHARDHEPYLRDLIAHALLVNPFSLMEAAHD